MATLNIEVQSQVDQAIRDLGRINKGFDLMGKANQDAAGALGVFGVSLTQFSNPLTMVASGLKASIDYTMKWGDEIDELTRITGTSARESSKLAVVLGDVGISTDRLRGAAKALKEQGLAPSLETLRKLAAEYQTLPEGAARTEWGTKKLGRAYFDLSEILTKTPAQFDELSAAAERSGKIMDEAGIQKAEDFGIKLKQLQDKLDGTKISLVSTEIAGRDMITWMSDAITGGENYIKMWQAIALKTELATGMIDQNTATIRAAEIAGLSHEDALRKVYAAEMDTTDASDRMAASLAYTKIVTEETAAVSVNYADASRDATQALADLQARQDGWATSTGQDVINALNQAGVEGREYELALIAIDDQLGTGFANEEETQKKLDALTKAYADGKISIDDYKSGLAALYDDAMPRAIQSFDDFTGRSEALTGSLNRIPRQIDVQITEYLNRVANQGHEQGAGGLAGGYQHGGSFIIPPGYNENFPIGPRGGASSGEQVTVTPAGQSGSSGETTMLLRQLPGLLARAFRDAMQLAR